MPVKEFKIEVSQREERGKSAMGRLRAEGFVPGIYYAHEQSEAIPFKVEAKLLHQALSGDAMVYHVTVGGERKNVLMKEIQYHPVTDDILHVDFMGVQLDEIVEVAVPLYLHGRPIGVRDEGGQLHQALMEIMVRCKAGEIPPNIDLDIVDLHLGESVHAGDLDLGTADLVISADTLVVTVAKPRGVEELAEAEEDEEEFVFEEGKEPAPGEEPEEKAKE